MYVFAQNVRKLLVLLSGARYFVATVNIILASRLGSGKRLRDAVAQACPRAVTELRRDVGVSIAVGLVLARRLARLAVASLAEVVVIRRLMAARAAGDATAHGIRVVTTIPADGALSPLPRKDAILFHVVHVIF